MLVYSIWLTSSLGCRFVQVVTTVAMQIFRKTGFNCIVENYIVTSDSFLGAYLMQYEIQEFLIVVEKKMIQAFERYVHLDEKDK